MFKRKRQDRSKAPVLLCCGPVDCRVPVPVFPSAEDWLQGPLSPRSP